MPNSSSPKLKEFVARLLVLERASRRGSGMIKPPSAFGVIDKLRKPLVKVMGMGGFRTLLSRSLALAGDEVPWLRGLHIRSDGSIEEIEDLKTDLTPSEVVQGESALAVRLIGQLVTFIGPSMTLQLMHEIWPELDEISFE